MNSQRLVSVDLKSNGTLEVVRSYPSNACLGNGEMLPDTVVKETYHSVAGKIVLQGTKRGKHIPRQVLPERFDFPEQE